MNCASCDECVYHLGLFVFFPGVFLSSRVTGACPVTTDLIVRVNVRTPTTTTTTTTDMNMLTLLITPCRKTCLGPRQGIDSALRKSKSQQRASYQASRKSVQHKIIVLRECRIMPSFPLHCGYPPPLFRQHARLRRVAMMGCCNRHLFWTFSPSQLATLNAVKLQRKTRAPLYTPMHTHQAHQHQHCYDCSHCY